MKLKDIEEKGPIGLGDQEGVYKGRSVSQRIHIARINSKALGRWGGKWLPQGKPDLLIEREEGSQRPID